MRDIATHAALADAISQGMQLKRTLDPMIRNLYNGNPNKIEIGRAHV